MQAHLLLNADISLASIQAHSMQYLSTLSAGHHTCSPLLALSALVTSMTLA